MTNYYELDGLPPTAKAAALRALAEEAERRAREDGDYVPDPDVSDEERDFTDFRREAAAGAVSDRPAGHDVYAEARRIFEESLSTGMTEGEAQARALSVVNHAAESADPKIYSQVLPRNHDPIAMYGSIPDAPTPATKLA